MKKYFIYALLCLSLLVVNNLSAAQESACCAQAATCASKQCKCCVKGKCACVKGSPAQGCVCVKSAQKCVKCACQQK